VGGHVILRVNPLWDREKVACFGQLLVLALTRKDQKRKGIFLQSVRAGDDSDTIIVEVCR